MKTLSYFGAIIIIAVLTSIVCGFTAYFAGGKLGDVLDIIGGIAIITALTVAILFIIYLIIFLIRSE